MGKEIISSVCDPNVAVKPFRRVFIGVMLVGLLLAIFGFASEGRSEMSYIIEYGQDTGRFMYAMPTILAAIGILMMFGGIFLLCAFNFLSKKEAATHHITVYENGVAGKAAKIQQGATEVVDFQLSFDKIESVSADPTKVTLHTASSVIRCAATNGEAIKNAILPHIQHL